MVACGPAQVTVQYSVAAGCLLIAAWCSAFVVEMVVGAAAVSTFGGLVASHAHVGWMAKLEAVFTY